MDNYSHKNTVMEPLTDVPFYDVAIIGGGLAGLTLAIQLAKQKFSVILFEKETYPFHRVCGEYISLESWPFLESIGYPLKTQQLPIIKKLIISSPGGKTINHHLPLGGFGISRYKIDAELAALAKENAVTVKENVKVDDVFFYNDKFAIHSSAIQVNAKVVAGCFGKRSNLDTKWNRAFIKKKPGKLNNYIGVKYHIKTNFANDSIALHNFSNGYCGISKIEDDKYCLCYLTTADNLKKSGNSIALMEKNILYKNPWLKNIFSTAEFIWKSPVTIAQISFDSKKQIENHMLMIGDAASMITPLCGNGMSMAMHSSKIAAPLISQFLKGNITRQQLEQTYENQWNTAFLGRIKMGRQIQRMFGKTWTTNLFIQFVKPFPKIISYFIRQTHGLPF